MPPDVPFGWFDVPPSVNRLLGVQWLVRLLHPKRFPEPLGPVLKRFHTLFYHREPTEAQLRALLQAAGLPRWRATYRSSACRARRARPSS